MQRFFNKNSEYRYAVVVGLDKLPYSMCKTLEEAKEDERVHFMSGGKAEISITKYEYCETKYVECKECRCRTQEMYECCCDREGAEERAIKLWNKRTCGCKKQEGY